MGKIQKHLPVKLISAITFHPELDIESVLNKIEDLHSSCDMRSEIYEFSVFTSYYEQEMNDRLKKYFVSFEKLFNPEELPYLKVKTNMIEEEYLVNGKRRVNIDPGYITQAKVVLATTKNYSHRIYLGKGIFGDVHMQYSNNSYQPQSWTYPDYKDAQNIIFFNQVRRRYLEQLGKT